MASTNLAELEHEQLEQFDGIQQKLLNLLGIGISPEQAALAVGCDASYVSNLLSTEKFAEAVVQIRYNRLKKASEIDQEYETIESILVQKLKEQLVYLVKPEAILNALTRINATKRRGAGFAPASVNQDIVNFILPKVIVNKFTVNQYNQVVQAGDQILTTIDSNVLLKEAEVKELKDVTPYKEGIRAA